MERIHTLLDIKTLARNAAKERKQKYLDHAVVVLDNGVVVLRVFVYVTGKVQSFDVDAFTN